MGQAKGTLKDFTEIFKERHVRRAILNSAVFTALFKTTKDYLQPILESFALVLPFFLFLDDVKRSGVVVGGVYFFVYLLTSYASRNSDQFSRRFRHLAAAINLTFLAGAGFMFFVGLATWQNLTIISIILFLGFYVLQNLRKPMNVAYISDQISHKVMASGLSVEAQITTLLVAVFAPILGVLADLFGLGIALIVLGLGTLLSYSLVAVKDQ